MFIKNISKLILIVMIDNNHIQLKDHFVDTFPEHNICKLTNTQYK